MDGWNRERPRSYPKKHRVSRERRTEVTMIRGHVFSAPLWHGSSKDGDIISDWKRKKECIRTGFERRDASAGAGSFASFLCVEDETANGGKTMPLTGIEMPTVLAPRPGPTHSGSSVAQSTELRIFYLILWPRNRDPLQPWSELPGRMGESQPGALQEG